MRTREQSTFACESSRPAVRRSHALMLGALAASVSAVGHAQTSTVPDVRFNDDFLMKPRGRNIDISRFERGNPIPAGDYPVDIYVNGNWNGKGLMRFIAQEGKDSAVPCFDKALLQRLGLNFDVLSDAARAEIQRAGAGECVDLAVISESASYQFDLSDLRFDVSLPQAIVLRAPRGYVSPELWDEGVPSATLGYNASTFHYSGHGNSGTQSFIALNAGVNIGSWHFRQQSSLQQATGRGTSYQDIATYLQHDIPSLKSQLILGDSYTDGAVFDSIGVRGVQLVTDDRMLPDSLRGYAPVIRGIATSNARVTVTQNGNRLYETVVAPGAFEINDLYATGYGGNLLVTVTEADGSQHSYTVPYASVTQLLRPGATRYNLIGGVIRDAQIDHHNALVQGTIQRGISNAVTGYAGTILADGYIAGLVGAAFNTPFGALSADVTEAQASVPHSHQGTTGQSFRIGYSKFMPQTDTNLAVAAYRYSSSGFWTLRDAMLGRDSSLSGQDPARVDRQRNQIQVTLNQSLGERGGNLYVVGSTADYWNRHGTMTQFQLGYNNTVRLFEMPVSYNLSMGRQSNGVYGQTSNQVYASVSVPLGKSPRAPQLTTSVVHDSSSGWSEQAMLTGSAGVDSQFSYGVFGSHMPGSTMGGGNAQYRSPYATFSGSASGGSGYAQASAGIQGAIVAHPGGVTLANYLGDTIAVVEAKGAEGARITNGSGVRIDSRGYAVVPYLAPYSLNTVDIDPKGIPLDVEFKATSQQVAPRANSVVMVRFPTVIGRSAVISTKLPNGASLPFGATVTDEKGNAVGAIGQNSQLFVSGIADEGTLVAKWGSEADQTCEIAYRLPPKSEDRGAYAHATGVCGDVGIASNGASKQAAASKPVAVESKRVAAMDGAQSAGHAPSASVVPSAQEAARHTMPAAPVEPVAAATAIRPVALLPTFPTLAPAANAPLRVSTEIVKRTSVWDDWQPKPAISTGESQPPVDATPVVSTSYVAPAIEEAVAANVATTDQTDGAGRLLQLMSAAPVTTKARVSTLSMVSMESGAGQ
ncbi:fimbria/pilus outer membrane usher protein [Paraburkholderia diazotrophica]|uniref:Outer membrane usher protein n=1 Tax=Paraburkholderia diazotrophica TaxID=667676 RepID=A0A1H6VM78_9BURK|nr:fimbria/pilus outer membrane usher protein [Paraburkholderia diazotrophica]SEJ04144.1 outer membrane usher protein [Paraburkholderia diazotrophica]